MNRKMTLKEYRLIDLTLFAAMLALFEFIIVFASTRLFPSEAFTVSLAAAIVSIVYMRWGYWGGIHACLAGVLFALYNGGDGKRIIVYAAGNLLSLAAASMVANKPGYEKVRTGKYLSLAFPILVLALMQLGRAAVAILLGASLSSVLDFFTTDALSYVFTVVIIWIARRLDGIYENQKHYLLRMSKR